MPTINELKTQKAILLDSLTKLNAKTELTPTEDRDFDAGMKEVEKINRRIEKAAAFQAAQANLARPIGGGIVSYASPKTDRYEKDASICIGGMIRTFAMAKGNAAVAAEMAVAHYGESHPVANAVQLSKSLSTLAGSAGAFVVPPDFTDALIPLLYAKTVVRRAGAMTMPMPNGTMTIPKMTAGATAAWVGEARPIAESAPIFGQIVATAHKLAALVPVSNDLMNYSTPAFDEKVRNDIVMQIALAEDAAFIRGVGTQYSPRGLKSSALSTNIIASTPNYSLTTASSELGAMVNRLEMANLSTDRAGWLMSPKTKNYLLNVQNSNGFYVFKSEMTESKTVLGIPYFTTTQIPVNLTVAPNSDCSELYLVDFSSVTIFEGRKMEFAISSDASYVDANGNTQSAFQNDLTVMRATIAEDFQVNYPEAVVMNTGVRWAPTLS